MAQIPSYTLRVEEDLRPLIKLAVEFARMPGGKERLEQCINLSFKSAEPDGGMPLPVEAMATLDARFTALEKAQGLADNERLASLGDLVAGINEQVATHGETLATIDARLDELAYVQSESVSIINEARRSGQSAAQELQSAVQSIKQEADAALAGIDARFTALEQSQEVVQSINERLNALDQAQLDTQEAMVDLRRDLREMVRIAQENVGATLIDVLAGTKPEATLEAEAVPAPQQAVDDVLTENQGSGLAGEQTTDTTHPEEDMKSSIKRVALPGSFGAALTVAREAAGVTMAELARRSEVTQSGISECESGKRKRPTQKNIAKLVKILPALAEWDAK